MRTTPLTRIKLALGVCLGVMALCGVIAYAATPTILGVGTTPFSAVVGGPAQLTARRLIIPVNDPPSNWHYHPGTLLSVVGNQGSPAPGVNLGSVTIEDGCGGAETYGPGQAFEQAGGRVHRAVNYSGDTVEEHNMFVNPASDTRLTVNIPGNQQLCGPPLGVDECKDDGWAKFTFPRSFGSQGECVQFMLTGN